MLHFLARLAQGFEVILVLWVQIIEDSPHQRVLQQISIRCLAFVELALPEACLTGAISPVGKEVFAQSLQTFLYASLQRDAQVLATSFQVVLS